MSALSLYNEDGSFTGETLTGREEIARVLGEVGVQFERWQTQQPLDATASEEEVLAAYRADVDRLNRQYGFQSVDVVALTPDHPDRETESVHSQKAHRSGRRAVVHHQEDRAA